MNFMSIAKGIVGGIISYGVNNAIGNIIKSTTPEKINNFNKIAIAISAFAVSSMISDRTTDYVFTEIDKLIPVKEETETEEVDVA